MQPVPRPRRPIDVRLRAVLRLLLALGLLAAPTSTVRACSCGSLGGPIEVAEQAIADAEVAFIGTVVGTEPAPPDPDGFGPMVRYAFSVERATVPVGDVIEVRALDDGGGGSCGFTFGLDETWFVSTYEHHGMLHTGLCNGNMQVGSVGQGDRDRISAMLTARPEASRGVDAQSMNWLALGGIAIVALVAGMVSVIAFRRDRVR